ncbi:sensor histidine kinase [Paenibacillus sp. GCM10012306]|uniref:sensor histidine kinase n=1 Tax=Paenibacillus sp. GCM10012306 TaxID=3317342 RepID=UPI0036239375
MKQVATQVSGVFIGRAMKCFLLISILFTILEKYSITAHMSAILVGVTLFSLGNDYFRMRFNSMSAAWYTSFIISNILAGFLLFKAYSIGSQIYIIILLVEIVVSTKKIPVSVLCLHFAIFTVALLAEHTTIKEILSSYIIIVAIVYLFRNVVIEKAKTQGLNQELQVANAKLLEYSSQIQELTISTERTRIAQELHDSLGHYLVALNMNLEYANATVDVEPNKAKVAITKSHELSKECIVNLRKAVVLLREEPASKELLESLHEIFANFQGTNKIQFELNMDDDIERVDSDIKHCIYKTVQEAITNGIKHGEATYFSIDIHKNMDQISLLIHNNGAKCTEIIKSNGIQGIENRITALGGTVSFYCSQAPGFNVEASIPKIAVDFQG